MLTVFCGPMFAGKTSALISNYFSAVLEGKSSILLKPHFDNRYSETSVVSHDKEEAPSVDIYTPDDIFYHGISYDYVFIDEIQFLDQDEHTIQISKLLTYNKNIFVAGLDMDSYGVPFGTTAWCMAAADNVFKLRARCDCGSEATMTRRKSELGVRMMVGGSDQYEAVCRRCFNNKSTPI